MQEDLNQLERNETWGLALRPGDHSVITNKLDENGVIIRNKARLIAQGYNQEERYILKNFCWGSSSWG